MLEPYYAVKEKVQKFNFRQHEPATLGRAVREETGRRQKIREETGRRKKIKMRGKVVQPRDAVFFQWFVAPEGGKAGSLKRLVRSHLAR